MLAPRQLYQHLVRQEGDDGSLARVLRELHQQLWSPLASALPADCNEVIISPDAQLNFLSFATLLNSSNRFLGEEFWISYVSSGRDFLAEAGRAPSAAQLLVWANPVLRCFQWNGRRAAGWSWSSRRDARR